MRPVPLLLTAVAVGLGLAAAPPSGAAPSPAPATPTATTATLITGDQITETPDSGGRQAIVSPAASGGIGRALLHLDVGGHSYEIPAAAVPYLNNGLDPSLFDVDALLGAEHDGRIPVTIGRQGAAPTLPGVTTTATTATGATGYLTADGARKFGAALVAQYRADRGRHAFGAAGLFPAGTSVALAGTAPAATASPRFAMHTVTLAANDLDGTPDSTGVAILYNLDDSNRFGATSGALQVFYGGQARYSVPAGHYAAVATFVDTDAAGDNTALREVSEPEFTVSGDQTVRIDERRATSRITMVTPRPALAQETGFAFRRVAAVGPSLYWDVVGAAGVPVYVAPARTPVRIGTLQDYPYQRLTSPPAAGTPYEYDLQYAAYGIVPDQRYVVRTGQVATVDAYYYSDLRSIGQRQRAGQFSFELNEFVLRDSHDIELPRHQTEYVSADPTITWFGGISKYSLVPSFVWWGGQYETAHHYTPGSTPREDWNRYPLHPAGPAALATDGWQVVPGVTRAGDTERFALYPFSDNTFGHNGFGLYGESRDAIGGGYSLTQDGTTVASGPLPPTSGDPVFEPQVTLSPAPSSTRLVLDASRTGPMYLLSTASHTEWTWRSAHEQGGALPSPLVCTKSNSGTPDTACAVEPLLTVAYALGGQSVDGSTANGAQTLDLTVGHLQDAATPAITGATVQFSTDGGTTWQDATVTGGAGKYRAAFTVANTTGHGQVPADLRVTATDAAGGSISETTTDAFVVNPT